MLDKRSTSLICVCQSCDARFSVKPHEVAMGRGRYCTLACSIAGKMAERRRTLRECFWLKVAKVDPDWLWTGAVNRVTGYGVLRLDIDGQRCNSAHRAAWVMTSGPVPDGLYVLHTCDVRLCVRNDGPLGEYWANGAMHPRRGYLWLGTHADNTADMMAKGRQQDGSRSGWVTAPERFVRGERNHAARLTEPQVVEIRRRYAAGGVTQRQLATAYGVGQQTISQTLLERSWKHLLASPSSEP